MKQKLLIVLFVLTCLIGHAFAQSRQVSGKVTSSSDGTPIAGASVTVVGSPTSVQTDRAGNYSISVGNGAILNFSYIGYTAQRISVAAQTSINVQLIEEDSQLDEVVVVAYGTAKKSEVTGSMATMGAEDLDKRTVTNVSNALAGMAPGISVSSGNGQPGSGATVRLRGIGSMGASSSPLYVVDGAVFDGNIGDINATDIESISVLKDATSAALYGSRAGNGVIMITTKKGRGPAKLTASITQGFSERGIKEYDRVGTFDYYPTVFQAMKNSYMFPLDPKKAISEADAITKALKEISGALVYNPFNVANNEILDENGKMNPDARLKFDDFDWYKAIQRVGKRTDVNTSFSGSSEHNDFFASVGYLNDQGYLLNSDFKRFNGRINLNSQVKSWLKTGVNVSGANSQGTMAVDASSGDAASFSNPFNFIRGLGPIYPVHAYDLTTGAPVINPLTGEQYYDYGMHPGAKIRPAGASNGRNVVYETILNNRLNQRTMLGGRAFAEVKFLKDFTFTPSFSIDLANRNFDYNFNNIVGDGVSYDGLVSWENDITRSYTFNQVLSYKKSFDAHNINVILGHENYDYSFTRRSASKTGQVTSGITEPDNFVTPLSTGGYKNVNRMESYFGKVSYNYNQKYFLDGSIRRDGSSIFISDNRWGTFFSAGGAWAISKEDFLKDQTWISDLRLKASYGQVGNNNLLNSDGNRIYYAYQSLYNLGYNNGNLPGTILNSLPNPNLTWETSNTFNVGVNFALFQNRLRGEIEYYKRGSDQLLMSVPQPVSSPVTSIFQNVGSMYNRGLEISLSGDIIRNADFTWTVTKNFSTFKNKITKMPVETPVVTSGTKRREVGRDYYSFWLRQFKGVDPSDGASLYMPSAEATNSDLVNIDGVNYVKDQNKAGFAYSGSAIPDFSGSIINSFSYKDFTFSFLLTYQVGGKIYDSQYAGLMSTSSYGKSYHTDALNAWTTENKNSSIPRLDIANSSNINAASTRWLIDASYFSIRNFNLSYKLPNAWTKKIDLSSARLSFTGENLALFTKRKGLNPTEGFDGTNSTSYLPTRIFSFGLNVAF
ncbi:SusC/RagA family TonB-linked outer membrane protein [Sphingobacterium sp. Mn56C]|uniref:SusC/RagA family TonB-linked outer membrane protein n=1 Tax=Sphingobacterium sp. Mn56C TaxID=3395261 RepID=UPI003BE97BC1